MRRIDLTKPPKKGHAFIDVVNGVEGPSLYIGDENGGHRIAGPKPWGGGTTAHRFSVSLEELKEQIAVHERARA